MLKFKTRLHSTKRAPNPLSCHLLFFCFVLYQSLENSLWLHLLTHKGSLLWEKPNPIEEKLRPLFPLKYMCTGFSSIPQLSCGPQECHVGVGLLYVNRAVWRRAERREACCSNVSWAADRKTPTPKKSQRSIFFPSCMHSSWQKYASVK